MRPVHTQLPRLFDQRDALCCNSALKVYRETKASKGNSAGSTSQHGSYFVEEIVGEGVDENGHPAYCARPSVASAIDRCRPGQLRLSVDAPGMHVAVVKFEDWDKVELQDKQVST